jgi:hypothetical protein
MFSNSKIPYIVFIIDELAGPDVPRGWTGN